MKKLAVVAMHLLMLPDAHANGLIWDLAVTDWNSRGIPRTLDEEAGTNERKASSHLQNPRSRATVSMTSRGGIAVSALAKYHRDEVEGTQSLASAEAWVADALTFNVVNLPESGYVLVPIHAKANVKFSLLEEYSEARMGLCFGDLDCTWLGESMVPEWVRSRAGLPAPVNTVGPTFIWKSRSTGDVDKKEFKLSGSQYFYLAGNKVVIPIYFSAKAYSGTLNKRTGDQQVEVLAHLEMSLPAGVTCTSRSGVAFQNQCPAAK